MYSYQNIVYIPKYFQCSGNTAAISLIAALHGIDSEASIEWVRSQMEYIFVNNPMNISYMIQEAELGWSPRKPHHRSA